MDDSRENRIGAKAIVPAAVSLILRTALQLTPITRLPYKAI
jgi:hypothetical protein